MILLVIGSGEKASAEMMVPIVGDLYRNGINVLVYGKSLVNQSPVEIMRAHRFARQSMIMSSVS
jgi:glyceraldehyde 3-phosphate dehydrogenase